MSTARTTETDSIMSDPNTTHTERTVQRSLGITVSNKVLLNKSSDLAFCCLSECWSTGALLNLVADVTSMQSCSGRRRGEGGVPGRTSTRR